MNDVCYKYCPPLIYVCCSLTGDKPLVPFSIRPTYCPLMKQKRRNKEDQMSTPLGLVPKWLHDEKRAREIIAAMKRYSDANLTIPTEWVDELADLVKSSKGGNDAHLA